MHLDERDERKEIPMSAKLTSFETYPLVAALARTTRDGSLQTAVAKPGKQARPFGISAPRLPEFRAVPAAAPRVYDPRIAYLTTIVSAWAYADAQTMASQLTYYGLPNCSVREFAVVNRAMLVVAAAYFVRSEDGTIGVLAFRGTVPDDFINWLTDANTALTNFHYGRVHSGFYRNVEPLWADIAATLDEAISPSESAAGSSGNGEPGRRLKPLENLYITGHSLGAAMAVIAAARIYTAEYLDWQPLVRGVYTYGQPCVGDKVFCDRYQREFELYRHVYRTDVVPHLPPLDVGKFRHFGTELYATRPSDGWQVNSPPRARQALFVSAAAMAALADFFSRRLFLLRGLRLPYSLEDHGPQGYIDTSRASLG
jgi:hypothetical protein